ncbi:MAG: hypothetical protein ABFD80_12220 [Acidobacteriota bacterium]
MIIAAALWLLVWAGMYSDVSKFRWERLLESPAGFVLGLRAFLPIIAAFFAVLILKRSGRQSLILSRGPL